MVGVGRASQAMRTSEVEPHHCLCQQSAIKGTVQKQDQNVLIRKGVCACN